MRKGKAQIVEEILQEVMPRKKRDQIRNIWPQVEALRASRLTLKQISTELHRLGVSMTYPQFAAAYCAIRKAKAVKNAVRVSEDTGAEASSCRPKRQPKVDVLADLKEKTEAAKIRMIGDH